MEQFDRAVQFLEWIRQPPPQGTVGERSLMEQFMTAIFDIGLQLQRDPALRETAAFRDFARRSAELLVPLVPWVKLFLHDTENVFVLAFQHDEWLEVCRRRSALEFLVDISEGTSFEIYAKTLDTLKLDALIADVGEREGYLAANLIPTGIPPEHWWWWYPNSPPEE